MTTPLMGSDPAPFMANLFLYHFESKWVKNLKKDNLQKARRFGNTFRFIDDLFTINDNEFLRCFQEIYPPELELNLEHTGSEVSFLDLKITKEDNGQLSMKLFDKRDDFPFSIVRLPFSSSNMPTSMFYSSIGAEILRIGRVSSSLNNFLSSSKSLIKRALKQGASISRLEKTLKKTYGRQEVLKKFGKTATEFVQNVFD